MLVKPMNAFFLVLVSIIQKENFLEKNVKAVNVINLNSTARLYLFIFNIPKPMEKIGKKQVSTVKHDSSHSTTYSKINNT